MKKEEALICSNFVIFLFRHVINRFTQFKTIEHGKAKNKIINKESQQVTPTYF